VSTQGVPAPLPVASHKGLGADGVVQRVRLGAYGWIERDGCVLLCRISERDAAAGLWTLPGGGLDFGEDPAAGALREIREETGLDGTLGELMGIRSAVLEPHETMSGHRIQAVSVLYRVTVAGTDLRDETDGSTDHAAWVPFGELDALPSVPMLAWARGLGGR
jgi:ADP-ribose pyrophosphatase YjhB (NUDIX family)